MADEHALVNMVNRGTPVNQRSQHGFYEVVYGTICPSFPYTRIPQRPCLAAYPRAMHRHPVHARRHRPRHAVQPLPPRPVACARRPHSFHRQPRLPPVSRERRQRRQQIIRVPLQRSVQVVVVVVVVVGRHPARRPQKSHEENL
ncbi:hypothetical protein CRV24_007473 [Beauveria bassiana]|nr:hypothetical protein CRV24_007473 [Beauveria bassiana]